MRHVIRAMRAVRAMRDPDLHWLRTNFAPQLAADVDLLFQTFHRGLVSQRAFVFDEKEVIARVSTPRHGITFVSLEQADVPGFAVSFPLRHDGYPSRVTISGDDVSDDVLDEVVKRFRSFAEHYLDNPVSRSNYATPGEYLEWPSRKLVEPPRDPSAVPMEQVEIEVDRRMSEANISARLHGPDPADALRAREEMDAISEFRMGHLAKTTHGRWVMRQDPEFFMRASGGPEKEFEKDPPSPSGPSST